MKILVTGGAGFVGSHLCERLVQNTNSKCVEFRHFKISAGFISKQWINSTNAIKKRRKIKCVEY